MYKLFQRLKAWERYIVMTAICFILVQVWMDLKLPAYMGQISLLVQSKSTDLPEIVKNGGMIQMQKKPGDFPGIFFRKILCL